MVELGGFEQRLGGNAAGVEAGAAEGGTAVAVLPLIYTGDAELVLRGANRSRIARRAAADHHDVEGIGFVLHLDQTPSSIRPGSSSASLIATRNCTASRPSMIQIGRASCRERV